MKRLLSILLAFTLLVTPALASEALGWDLVRGVTTVGPGATVTTQKFWGDSRSDYRTEQFFTYTPGQGVSPVVAYGSVLPEKATLTAMAKALEGYGNRVLAGANGDYFVVSTGVPLGMVVTWGVLRSSSSYHYAVGFDGDGKAIVGKPDLTLWADVKGQHLAIPGGYNKTRVDKDGLTLFSRDFGPATKGGGEGVSVILRPVTLPEGYAAPMYVPPELTPPSDPTAGGTVEPSEEAAAAYQAALEAYQAAEAEAKAAYQAALSSSAAALETAPAQLSIGGAKVPCVVEQIVAKSGGVDIPEGRFVLTVGKKGDSFQPTLLSNLLPGDQVTLSVTSPDARWNTVQQAMGGYQLLLKDGAVQDGLDNTANPRTALGVKENGQVILYTIDGRRTGHSVGASMRQVAARLKELGCVDAVLFDGGGSTTFGATGAVDSAFSLQNKPSDGGQRAVTNALFFVTGQKPTGELGSLYVTPTSSLLLPGGKVDLFTQGIDTGYYPYAGPVGEVTYSVEGPGQMTGNTFTAMAVTARTEAVATVTAAGGQQGSTVLTVVPTPHGITLSDQATGQAVTSLNLDPGQSVDLTASAVWYGLPMTATDASFTWSVTPEVGGVDENGRLTAGSKAAAGNLTATAGEKTVSLPITVAGHVNLLADFEDQAAPQVKYGRGALTLRDGGSVDLSLPLAAGETDIGLWIYPEGELTLTAHLTLEDGTQTAVSCAVGAPGQWSFVRVPLPSSAVALAGLTVEPAVSGTAAYIDHITSTNGGILDETAPTVRLTYENGVVKAVLSDNVDKTFRPENLSITQDGKELPFTLEGSVASANVSQISPVFSQISATVSDISGNLHRTSLQISSNEPKKYPFSDIEGHWAGDYAAYLYDQKISNGTPGTDGKLLFMPASNITRGDFVTMLMRWLGEDLNQYETVELPFKDAGNIQPWAQNAVKAAYSLGIFTGSAEADGIYANPTQPLTRAQAFTLLGRVQPRGYPSAAQTFLDAETIPAWAFEHISSLAGQGVVNGYEGYVRPQDPITRAEVAKVLATMW